MCKENGLLNFWGDGQIKIQIIDGDRFNQDIFLGEVSLCNCLLFRWCCRVLCSTAVAAVTILQLDYFVFVIVFGAKQGQGKAGDFREFPAE